MTKLLVKSVSVLINTSLNLSPVGFYHVPPGKKAYAAELDLNLQQRRVSAPPTRIRTMLAQMKNMCFYLIYIII